MEIAGNSPPKEFKSPDEFLALMKAHEDKSVIVNSHTIELWYLLLPGKLSTCKVARVNLSVIGSVDDMFAFLDQVDAIVPRNQWEP